MQRFVVHTLGLTVKRRSGRPLSKAGVSGANLAKRRQYVAWAFGDSANLDAVGSAAEFADQRAHWRLRSGLDERQLFFIDESGVNMNATERRYGRAPRGVAVHERADKPPRGPNHSVLIAIGVRGIIAHRVLVGRGRGTKRVDFCDFLREQVGPAMRQSATAAGLPLRLPLYLVMDNASIHKGAAVQQALRSSGRRIRNGRTLCVVYQPPYAPSMNPVELVNHQLKQALRSGGALPPQSNALRHAIVAVLSDTHAGDHCAAYYAHCGYC